MLIWWYFEAESFLVDYLKRKKGVNDLPADVRYLRLSNMHSTETKPFNTELMSWTLLSGVQSDIFRLSSVYV